MDLLQQLATKWADISCQSSTHLVEGSPWGYLSAHLAVMAPPIRALARQVVAPLRLPELFVVLHTTGREVA